MQQRPLRPEPQSCQNMDAVETKSAEAAPSPLPQFPWRRWLREPLLHFLLIGMALFLGYRALNPNPDAGAQSNRIELTENDLRQMSVAWLARADRRPPLSKWATSWNKGSAKRSLPRGARARSG